jgi:1-phosphofructokinase/tagatose 6-phosphate kinase
MEAYLKVKGVLAIGLNPVMQKTIVLDHLWENEVNRSGNHMFSVAGKGANTARVLTELGARTIHISHAGGLYRQTFLDMLADDGVTVRVADSGSEIRLCYTLINTERHTVTEIVEEAIAVSPETDETIRSLFLDALESIDTVTISGTKAAGYKKDIIPWMVKEARQQGKIVVLDVKGDDLTESLPFGPTVIKPNLKEFSETLFPEFTFKEHKTESAVLEEVKKKMVSLERDFGVTTVLTQGAKSVFIAHGGAVSEQLVNSVTPVNTIGCGDSFTAGLAYGLHERLPIGRCVEIGIACGRANALNLKPGTIAGGDIPIH